MAVIRIPLQRRLWDIPPVIIIHGVIWSFRTRGTEDLFNGVDSKVARKTCPVAIWSVGRRKLDQLNRVTTLGELRVPPSNRLEALKHDRLGQFSIRINDQYRVCIRWKSDGPHDVEIVDYH